MKLKLTPQEFLKLYNVLRNYMRSEYGNDGDEFIGSIVKSLEKHMLKTLDAFEHCDFFEWEKRQFEKIELLQEQERNKKVDYVGNNRSTET